MSETTTLENILILITALGVIIWMFPGIKASLARSKQVESDWNSLVIPIALVIMLVIFLIMLV